MISFIAIIIGFIITNIMIEISQKPEIVFFFINSNFFTIIITFVDLIFHSLIQKIIISFVFYQKFKLN